MNRLLGLIITILLTINIISCTNKNSFTGFPGSKIDFYEITLPDSCIEISYTWGDSIKPYISNSKLVLGSYDNIETRVLTRFVNIPKNISNISNVKLYFTTYKNLLENETEISVHKITKTWNENQAGWENNTNTSQWENEGADFDTEEITSFFIQKTRLDSVIVNLPSSIIEYWIENDSLNYGLLLKEKYPQRNTQFVELYSTETYSNITAPILEFDYEKENGTSATYKSRAYQDTFIHNASQFTEIDHDVLSLWNIEPKAIAIKINLPIESFIEIDQNISNEDDMRHVTINRADLVLTKTDEDFPFTNAKHKVTTYFLNSDLDNQSYFDKGNLLIAHTTTDTLKNNTLNLNITAPVQAYVSKLKPNNGLIIKSDYQGMDFSRINFFGMNAENTENQPKINIKFSTFRKE